EASSGKELRTFPSVIFPAFHPKAQAVALIGFDAVVHLYDTGTGEETATFDPHPAAGTTRPDASVAKSLGNQLRECREKVTVSDPNNQLEDIMNTTMRVRQAQLGSGLRREYPWVLGLRPPSFSGDGKTLATPFGDSTYLWDVSGRNLLGRL